MNLPASFIAQEILKAWEFQQYVKMMSWIIRRNNKDQKKHRSYSGATMNEKGN